MNVFIVLVALLMAVPAGTGNAETPLTMTGTSGPADNPAGIDFVFVPGGCFRMGSANGNSDERPVHQVCVSAMHVGKYEVTQGQWYRVMGTKPSRFSVCGPDCPVEQVSWTDVQEFITRLNGLTGRTYRLPSEAEWEYACTSGGKDETHCGGGEIDSAAWYDRNSGNRTHPVGRKLPNGFGLFDMSGNVWEWVQDWKGGYPSSRQQDPAGSFSSSTRVRRGGSWQYGTGQARASWRSSGYPDDRALDLGFRLVISAR